MGAGNGQKIKNLQLGACKQTENSPPKQVKEGYLVRLSCQPPATPPPLAPFESKGRDRRALHERVSATRQQHHRIQVRNEARQQTT